MIPENLMEMAERADEWLNGLRSENERLKRELDEANAMLSDAYGTPVEGTVLFAERALAERAGGATHRHKKRGTEYVLIGIGKMQCDWWQIVGDGTRYPVDMREVAIYRSVDDDSLWARPREEFEDGRFETLTTEPAAPEGRQEARAYIVHAPEDDYYGTGPDRLQFHPLAQQDMDNGYRQTPLYERPALELSGNTRELIDRMAEAIRGDTTSDDTPWATLSEDRKIGWRGDAERALAVVKEYLTARRPSEQAVTEAMVEAAQDAWEEVDNDTGDLDACWRAALKAAMEAGR